MSDDYTINGNAPTDDAPTEADFAIAAAQATLNQRDHASHINIQQGKQAGDGDGTPAAQVRIRNLGDAELTEDELYDEAQRIASLDDGRANYAAITANLQHELKALSAELQAVLYDQNTGKPSYILQGPLRAAKEQTAKLVLQRIKLAEFTRMAVEKVRAERAELKAVEDQIAAVRNEWTQGDPAREKLLKDAIDRMEADDLAQRLLNMRRDLEARRLAKKKTR